MRHPSSQKYVDILSAAIELHDQKQKDYGTDVDPFANVRSSQDFGMPGWVGCMVRANDKMKRIQKAAQQTLAGVDVNMQNESVEDSFLDLLVYAGIGLVLFREANPPAQEEPF